MKIGFIGLGKMGAVMAPHLVGEDIRLFGFDVNWQMPEDSPVQREQSIDALSDCEVIFTMVPDGEVVLDIASQLIKARDGNGANALLIDMSSCHPDTAKKMHNLLATAQTAYLDAPVSGGVAKAKSAELMIMAGGQPEIYHRAEPLLAKMGRPAHIGPNGAGYAMKALNNYVSAAGLVSSFQALATAQKFGIAPEKFQTIINGSTGRNNTTEVKIDKFVLTQAFNSGFALQLMAKDVGIASDIIAQSGFDAPITQALADYLDDALEILQHSTDSAPDHTEIYRHITEFGMKRN